MSDQPADPWLTTEIESLRSAAGRNALRVAASLGRSPRAVQDKARRIGIPAPRMPHARYWSPETKRRALELRSSGNPVSHISASTGVPFGTVRRWVYGGDSTNRNTSG